MLSVCKRSQVAESRLVQKSFNVHSRHQKKSVYGHPDVISAKRLFMNRVDKHSKLASTCDHLCCNGRKKADDCTSIAQSAGLRLPDNDRCRSFRED